MNGIPIIDFAKVSESSEEISKEINSALANVGFLYIVNHGVDMSKVNNITNRCRRVFVICNINSDLRFEMRSSKVNCFLSNRMMQNVSLYKIYL